MPFLLGIVVLVQAMMGVGCLVYANRALVQYATEIAAIPDDEQVLAMDRQNAIFSQKLDAATVFSEMPRWMQLTLGGSTTALILSCYVLVFLPRRLFAPFSLTDCLSELDEPPYDTFIPGTSRAGLAALAALLASILCFARFRGWAARRTKQDLATEKRRARAYVQATTTGANDVTSAQTPVASERSVGIALRNSRCATSSERGAPVVPICHDGGHDAIEMPMTSSPGSRPPPPTPPPPSAAQPGSACSKRTTDGTWSNRSTDSIRTQHPCQVTTFI